MELIGIKKTKDGRYLKNYELEYINKAGKEKKYEIVSHSEITGPDSLGSSVSGISIAATCDGKLLLLKEFRMGVNRTIYNLCAGMVNDGESVEDCISRELYEETGLKLAKAPLILPPAFAAVSMSDIKNQLVFACVEGELEDHTSDNEQIKAGFYSKEEVSKLLETEEFSSRAQVVAFFFSKGALDM